MDFPVLISAESIRKRVRELGKEISRQFKDSQQPVLLVGLLKGSFIFLADLVRELDIACEIDFIEVSSYGQGTESSGQVKITKDLQINIEGRELILVEDIVDTGLTLNKVVEILERRKPRSLSICSLLHKPAREKVHVPIHYLGFTIEDHFVVGYGLDCAEAYRQLKDIVIYQT